MAGTTVDLIGRVGRAPARREGKPLTAGEESLPGVEGQGSQGLAVVLMYRLSQFSQAGNRSPRNLLQPCFLKVGRVTVLTQPGT